jgi:exopolysaccharide production protein ExoZ
MPHASQNWTPHLPSDTSLPIPSTIRQIDALQLLRAVAVMLVIWCHAGQVLHNAHSHRLPDLGVFGVDLFFVISGFILSLTVLKEKTPPGLPAMRDFMKRRFLRIYPIYWVICLATVARLAISHHLFDHDWIASVFLLPSFHYPGQTFLIGYSWTMNFEIFFYFLLGLVLVKTIKWAVPVLIFLLVSSTALGSILGIRHPIIILVANPVLLEFVFGALIALLYARLGRHRLAGIFAAAIGCIATFYLAAQNLPSIANGEQMILVDNGSFARVATWGICAALIVGGTVFWSPSMKNALGKCFVLLGNASYSTYLASGLFLEYSHRLYFRLHPPPLLSIGSCVLFQSSMVLFIVVGGYAVYSFLEKPLLRSLQARFLHPAPAQKTRLVHTDQPASTGYPATRTE